MTMSETGQPSEIGDGTVLQDQIEACDQIMDGIIESHQDPSMTSEEDQLERIYGLYKHVRTNSIQAFNNRFQASALYDALKSLFRSIGQKQGYEHLMHYMTKYGKERISDDIDNCVHWFKLYSGIVLETQPEITYEWAVSHFKEYRDMRVSHPETIQAPSEEPDPTYVSSIVPLWCVLEDVFRLWRKVLDMAEDDRETREYVLQGEIDPDGGLETDRYGFIRDLNHRPDEADKGYITDYRTGEDGGGCVFNVGDTDFFPSVGDVVQYQVVENKEEIKQSTRTLTVRDTVTLVE
jgi:hypothetical protein